MTDPATPNPSHPDTSGPPQTLWGHTDPEALPAPPRKWCAFITLAYATALVYGSLLPWDAWSWAQRNLADSALHALAAPGAAVKDPATAWRSWLERPVDAAANVLLYVPLGLAGFALLRSLGRGRWGGAVAAVAIAAGASWTLESLQSGLPSRYASAADVALNTLGAALGVALAAGFGQALAPAWTRWRIRAGQLRTTAALWRRRPTGVATLLILASSAAAAGVLTLTLGRMHGPAAHAPAAEPPLTWLFERDYGEGLARLALLGALAIGSGVCVALAFARRQRGGLVAAALWAGSWALGAEACRAGLAMDQVDPVAPAAVAAAAALAVTPLRWAARAIPPRCRRQGRNASSEDERRAGAAA